MLARQKSPDAMASVTALVTRADHQKREYEPHRDIEDSAAKHYNPPVFIFLEMPQERLHILTHKTGGICHARVRGIEHVQQIISERINVLNDVGSRLRQMRRQRAQAALKIVRSHRFSFLHLIDRRRVWCRLK